MTLWPRGRTRSSSLPGLTAHQPKAMVALESSGKPLCGPAELTAQMWPLLRQEWLNKANKNSPAATSNCDTPRPAHHTLAPPWLQGLPVDLGRGTGTHRGTAAALLAGSPSPLRAAGGCVQSGRARPRMLNPKPAWEA